MAQWDDQSDSGMETTESPEFVDSMDSGLGRESSNTPESTSSQLLVIRSESDANLKKTPTGLPHNPQAPPSVGTGPTGDPLFSNDNVASVPFVHADFNNDFGDSLFDDDDAD